MIDIEKPAVKSVQEPVDEKQEKELANTENIFAKGEGWGTYAIHKQSTGRQPGGLLAFWGPRASAHSSV